MGDPDWLAWSRETAAKLADPIGAADCLLLLRARWSPNLTFDKLGFLGFLLRRPARPTDASVAVILSAAGQAMRRFGIAEG